MTLSSVQDWKKKVETEQGGDWSYSFSLKPGIIIPSYRIHLSQYDLCLHEMKFHINADKNISKIKHIET